MKKVIFTLIIAAISMFSATNNSVAQNAEFGAKVLIGTSTISDEPNQELKFSFGIGASLEYKVASMFSIQPEILYVTRGGTKDLNINALNKDVSINTNLSYIEIPILAKLVIGQNSIFAGPYFAIKTSGEVTTSSIEGLYTFKPDFNTFDFGFSLGYERKIQERMLLDGRVNFGTRNITDGAPIFANLNPYKNPRNFAVMFGFKYILF